jgi:hypothetical protein
MQLRSVLWCWNNGTGDVTKREEDLGTEMPVLVILFGFIDFFVDNQRNDF